MTPSFTDPSLSLVLFDDAVAAKWEPFALTRPAGELLFGTLRLRERAERVFGARCVAHLAAAHLRGFEEAGAPPVLTHADAPADGDRLFLSSRAVPDWTAGEDWRSQRDPGPVCIAGKVVGWYAPAGTPAPSSDFLATPESAEDGGDELAGMVLEHVWELMSRNPAQISEDVAGLFPDREKTALPAGVWAFGEHPVILGERAIVEPGVVFDTSSGPVWLDEGSRVRALSRVEGPVYLGRGSTILGGTVVQASIGPVCKIRGEFAESVALGWANKAHDGHIGHAYLGAWVNLGAGTTNSDLKNNYSPVRLWTPDGDVDTGELFVGCFLGDHVKTGIGLLLNTGTVVGAGSNLYGAAMPPKYVPPFSWGTGSELSAYRVDRFLQVAERAMARRKVALTDGMRRQLEVAWERARGGS